MVKTLFRTYCNLYSAINADKVTKILSKFPKIFFYHGVTDNITDPRVQSVQMKFDLFKEQINYLIKNSFEIISIQEFENRFNSNEFRGSEVILTFDDGYQNNLDIVYPFLSSNNIPFSVFISTKHIEEKVRFPAYTIRSLVYYTDKLQFDLESLKKVIDVKNMIDKEKAEKELIHYIKSSPIEQVNVLVKNLKDIHANDLISEIDAEFISEAPMSWDDIKVLHQNGVEIGSHCHDHILLHDRQNPNEIDSQLRTSKSMIEDKIGECKYLVYPNGTKKDVSLQSMKFAEKNGYKMAFSTWMKNVNYKDNRFFIPRYIAPNNMNEFRYLVNNYLFNAINKLI